MKEFEYPFDSGFIMQKKRKLKRELLEQDGLITKKIAIVGGSTIGEIKNILELFLLHHGIKPEFYEGGYALFYENLVFDDGSLKAFEPDILYIHTSMRNIKNWPSQKDSDSDIKDKLAAEIAMYENAWAAAEAFDCPIIQNNFELPVFRSMGNRDAFDSHGRVNYVNELNRAFASYAASHDNFFINDINYLSACVGIDNWCDDSIWYLYKYAMDTQFIPLLAHSIASIIKSIFGKNKKSVILDLDNTLWGGIIGDDGADGLYLGLETPTGMAYTAFQEYLKELSNRGIMLNVCSKNEENIALEGFMRSDSTLKREDFICFKANWNPKSLNIAEIAAEINIMSDSFVFIDDNPAEREIVKREIGSVTVPEVTSPESYIKAIDRGGYFETTALSQDDKKRNEMYKQNAKRAEIQRSFGDYNDYLRSLEMTCEIGNFTAQTTERITQLVNKTNQFNLTTRRYTATEIEDLVDNKDYLTLYGKLVDKFGDNGLVTVIIGEKQADNLNLDLWIMSCRTFKRHLEYAMFDELIAYCKENNIKTITANYFPTAKNLLVREFYGTIGFEKVTESDEGTSWKYDVVSYSEPLNKVMKIEKN